MTQQVTPIALIGSGIFAKEEHLPAIRAASSSVKLVAVYSRSFASAADLAAAAASEGGTEVDIYCEDAQGNEGKVKGGFGELLKRGDVGGVVIA